MSDTDTIMASRTIILTSFCLPIPPSPPCWLACYEGMAMTGPYGSGATPQQAINHLVDNDEREREL